MVPAARVDGGLKTRHKCVTEGGALAPPPRHDWSLHGFCQHPQTSSVGTELQLSFVVLNLASAATIALFRRLPPAALMRTSRISRDTSRFVAATRAHPPLRQTRSGARPAIRDFSLNTDEAGRVARNGKRESAPVVHHGDTRSESELSSVPDSGSEGEEALGSRKRKRGQAVPVAVKEETKELSITAIASPEKGSKPKKARRVPAKKVKGADGYVKIEPPPNWEEIYALTRQMRNENVAPVDTMGCESLADVTRTPRDQRFQTLVALMLSSQTKDTVTSVAIRGMQENMPGVCERAVLGR